MKRGFGLCWLFVVPQKYSVHTSTNRDARMQVHWDSRCKEIGMAKRIIFIIVFFLLVIFVIQNTQVVDVQLFFWKVSMSRALMIFAIFLLGLVTGWVSRMPSKKK
jgi:uncharacterized integral membrane protein